MGCRLSSRGLAKRRQKNAEELWLLIHTWFLVTQKGFWINTFKSEQEASFTDQSPEVAEPLERAALTTLGRVLIVLQKSFR